MRLLIASDLHGSLESLDFLRERAAALKPDLLVLLGDLVYHGPRNPLPSGYDTLGVLDTFAAVDCPLVAVRGNCDGEVDLNLLPFATAENAWLSVDNLRVFASHGHLLPDVPPMPARFPQGTVFLRGHTHIPRGETRDGYHFWNPGSLSLPKGGSPRSYAVYEDGCFRVLDMQGREVLRHWPRQND